MCTPYARLGSSHRPLNNYKLHLLGVQETRWTGSAKRLLATEDIIIWSGGQDNIYLQGVALIMDKETSRALLRWTAMYVNLSSRFAKLSTVVCYAHIKGAEEADKNDFYDSLQTTVE